MCTPKIVDFEFIFGIKMVKNGFWEPSEKKTSIFSIEKTCKKSVRSGPRDTKGVLVDLQDRGRRNGGGPRVKLETGI